MRKAKKGEKQGCKSELNSGISIWA